MALVKMRLLCPYKVPSYFAGGISKFINPSDFAEALAFLSSPLSN